MTIPSKYVWTGIVLVVAGALAGTYFWHPWMSPSATSSPAPSAAVTPLADDMVQLDSPLPGAQVTSPLVIRGKARGTWFFEASFPVVLTDWDGKIIAQTAAHAQGDWMTTDWVAFEATLTFTKPLGNNNRGTLILRKDNPSGLPEHDDSREITVFFK